MQKDAELPNAPKSTVVNQDALIEGAESPLPEDVQTAIADVPRNSRAKEDDALRVTAPVQIGCESCLVVSRPSARKFTPHSSTSCSVRAQDDVLTCNLSGIKDVDSGCGLRPAAEETKPAECTTRSKEDALPNSTSRDNKDETAEIHFDATDCYAPEIPSFYYFPRVTRMKKIPVASTKSYFENLKTVVGASSPVVEKHDRSSELVPLYYIPRVSQPKIMNTASWKAENSFKPVVGMVNTNFSTSHHFAPISYMQNIRPLNVSVSHSLPVGGPAGPPQQWGGNVGANNASGSSAPHLWGGAKKENDWNTPTSGGSGGWGDPRAPDPRAPPMDHRDIRPDPREMRAGSNDQMRLVDPQLRLPVGDMRGDLRGITGRLNGSGAETFWPQGGPQAPAHHMHHQGKMPVGPGGNGGAGWEEPSPPSQRRNMPNYDDGTSLWGNPQQGKCRQPVPARITFPDSHALRYHLLPANVWRFLINCFPASC